MTQKESHENYLIKAILSQSISSENPSLKAEDDARKNSSYYFKDLKEKLLKEYVRRPARRQANWHFFISEPRTPAAGKNKG